MNDEAEFKATFDNSVMTGSAEFERFDTLLFHFKLFLFQAVFF